MDNVAIKARAPSRIGIGGGGSDLPSFFERHGGAVLNVAINLFSPPKATSSPYTP
jgi:D-glycero-alpha-D-manno-heptose-7-phosphate kinase